MAAMTSLAEDLLKTRTIPELRERVNQLEKESNAKKTELQLMVGSKYHDFIQSADMINVMMNQSIVVEQQIKVLWKHNQSLVQKGHTLLSQTVPQSSRKRKTMEHSTLLADLAPESVWSDLNDCNVFESGVKVVCSHILLLNLLKADSSGLNKYFSSSSHIQLQELKFSKHTRNKFHSVVKMATTVSEDCELLLLDDSVGPMSASIEKSKALAVYSITSKLESHSAHASLLSRYLEAADFRIQEVFDGDLCTKRNKAIITAGATPDSDTLYRGLAHVVTILQEVTMDLYLLFFISINNHDTTDSVSGIESTGLIEYFQRELLSGVIHKLQVHLNSSQEMTDELSFDVSALIKDMHSVESSETSVSVKDRIFEWLSVTLKKVTERCKSVLASINNASDVAMLQQRVWRICTSVASSLSVNVATASVGLPTGPANAVQSDKKRSNSVSNSSLVVGVATAEVSAGFKPIHYCYSQAIWETACQELLLPANGLLHPSQVRKAKHQKNKQSSKTSSVSGSGVTSNILYSTVFRISFMHQVERLLHSSCADILASVKRTLVHALLIEGITLDPVSFTVKSVTSHSTYSKTSSVRLFNVAEYIRREFEHLLTTLYLNSSGSHLLSSSAAEDSASGAPTNTDDDPHAAATLTRALHGHCSQLIGQLLIVLRTISESCRDTLLSKGSLISGSEWKDLFVSFKDAKNGKDILISKDLQTLLKSYCTNPNMSIAQSSAHLNANNNSSFTVGKSLSIGNNSVASSGSFDASPVISGMLLIGRVAWLFKIRGRFLETSLRPQTSLSGGAGVPEAVGQCHNSERQVRSAFEIADTNGDGVINYGESLEAITALTTSDIHSNFGGISGSLTPSMTYSEFSLIVGGQLIVPKDQNPIKELKSCLDHIVALTHTVVATAIALEESKTLSDHLKADLTLSNLTKYGKDVERLFKISWVSKCVAGDVEDSMSVPSCCSASLSALLNAVNSRVLSSCVSIDTLQREIVSSSDLKNNISLNGLSSVSFEAGSASIDMLDDDEDGPAPNVLAILCGLNDPPYDKSNKNYTSVNPMLSQLVAKITFQLTFAIAYKVYNAQLQQLKQTLTTLSEAGGGSKAGLDSLLEDVSLQVIFDLLVLERNCLSYCVSGTKSSESLQQSSKGTTFYHILREQWRSYLDSVTAELVIPLVEESVLEYSKKVNLLFPSYVVSHASSNVKSDGARGAGSAAVQSSSEQILSRIFPVITSGVNPVSRFTLLPLALMSAKTAMTPTAATTANTPSKLGATLGRGNNIFASNPNFNGASPLVGVGSSSGNLTVNTDKSSAAAAGGGASKPSVSSGIKWW